MTRTQTGYIYKNKGSWYVSFYQDEVQPSGEVRRRQRAVRLAPICPDYRSKKSVEPLRDELFAKLKLNSPRYNIASTMTLTQFAHSHYLPRIETQLRPSVSSTHTYNWRKQVEPLCGHIRLRDFRTCDGQRVLDELAKRSLRSNILRRLKSLLSGIFSEAIRQGALDGTNPMREVRIPTNQAPAPIPTHAYSLEDIRRMLLVLGEPERTILATFAFTGMRKGEVAALRWEHWHDGALWIEQSAWRGHFTEPKSPKSKAPVRIIAPLAEMLEAHRNGKTKGLVFSSSLGTPLSLDNLARRVIRPRLEKANIAWHGWHAFRRGLATRLKQDGVDDKSIQAVLRHASYSVTLNSYVLAVPASVEKAMERYEQQVCTMYAPDSKVRVV